MLDELIAPLSRTATSWRAKGATSALVRVILLAFLAIAAMVGARFISLSYIQVTVGALAGVVLFCALYLGWAAGLPADKRDALNWRGNWLLPRRRMAFLWGALIWAAIALFTGKYVGGPVMGGITVAVVLCLWRQATATPEEIEQINEEAAEFEEWQLERAAELQSDATVEEYEKPKRRWFRK